MECKKCYKRVHECPNCKGRGGGSDFGNHLNCSKCSNTGYLCNTHDGYWK